MTESKAKISDLSSKLLKLEAKLGTSQSKLEKVKTSLRKELTESKAKISELSSKLLKLLEDGIVNNVTL